MIKASLALLFFLFDAWFLMLGIGVVHAEVLPAVIPCSYGLACVLTGLFGVGSAARHLTLSDNT